MPEELASKIRTETKERDIEVLPDNHEAVAVWFASVTQFGATGLNYHGLLAVMDIYSVKDRRDCFQRIQFMERVVLNERA